MPPGDTILQAVAVALTLLTPNIIANDSWKVSLLRRFGRQTKIIGSSYSRSEAQN
jgi:hypothetical protein